MDNLYLLIKYYQNEANADERAEVERWLSESDENQRIYDQHILVWKATQKADVLNRIDLDKDWETIVNNAKIKHLPKNNMGRLWLRIAAMIVLFIGAYWFIQNKLIQPDYLLVKNDSRDMIKNVTLEDGTKISLNYEASLYYPKHFKNKSRNVKLEGNAFFDVAKNPEKPFSIETENSLVEVLGTSFDVRTDQKETIVTVKTGKVRLSSKSNNEIFVELLPNEQAIHQGEKINKIDVATDNYLAWKTGSFKFDNHTLSEVIDILETRFHFTYQFKDEELKSRVLTADFNGENLTDILEVIQLSCQVKINQKSNHLTIVENE